ncbi:Asp-tRNA(Asn)/Glu-tRNA(Gln) amidotransferase subunit GatB [Candidatus Woesearchaeota archaeon]|nr:Asp-tRNA(Asn)/Glu-tRNA(Gln) amidotransferase subunit GatB [Candidatus Woesearchaeota archaeon]
MTKFTSDIVIGLEIHANTASRTKLFCSCPNTPSSIPNSQTCPTCLGMPGSKPVLNKLCVEQALQLCLALDCTIAKQLVFSRKSYFYPDLAKNYQITQYELPLGQKGKLTLGSGKEIGIIRVHLEEDPAALIHPGSIHSSSYVLIDYNRSGTPLLEIVTEPAMTSPEEAREFMNALITVLQYLEIFDVDTCIIKADANISIRESGYVRAEVKNITGFKEIERALFYEVDRQKHDVAEGGQIIAETRGWDAEKGITYTLRTKESEEDYGYIIDPDLVPVEISPQWAARLKAALPELAQDKVRRFIKEHKISPADAGVLAQEKLLAELFEKVAAKISPQLAARWLRRELVRVLNYHKKTMKELRMDESHIIDLLSLVEKKKITEATAQRIMEQLMEKPFDVAAHVKRENLELVADAGQLDALCREAIRENQKAVDDYKNGEEKALHFLMGIVMKKSKGRASPREVVKILKTLVR